MVLSNAQQVFMVFYAILYGATLGSMNSFIPFPWGDINKRFNGRRYNLRRVGLSLFLLNFLPFVYFIWMYILLEEQIFCLDNWYQLLTSLLILSSALGVFAFYRLYHIIFWWDKQSHKRWDKQSHKILRLIPFNISFKIRSNIFWPNFSRRDCKHGKKKFKSCYENEDCKKHIKDCWRYINRGRNTEWYIHGYWIASFFYLTPSFFIAIIKYIQQYFLISFISIIVYLVILFIIFFELYQRAR